MLRLGDRGTVLEEIRPDLLAVPVGAPALGHRGQVHVAHFREGRGIAGLAPLFPNLLGRAGRGFVQVATGFGCFGSGLLKRDSRIAAQAELGPLAVAELVLCVGLPINEAPIPGAARIDHEDQAATIAMQAGPEVADLEVGEDFHCLSHFTSYQCLVSSSVPNSLPQSGCTGLNSSEQP